MAFLLIFATTSIAQSPPPHPPPIVANRASDSYAIYSLLLSGGVVQNTASRTDHNLAIADTTVNIDDMNPASEPDSELQPPPGSERAFQEAVQDFRTRRQERAQLDHRFKLDRSYRLLSADEVSAFRKNLAANSSGSQPRSSITLFSEVYFNPRQTAALVYTDNVCTSPCGNGQWIYLEKRDGQWVRRFSSIIDRADSYAIYSLLMPGVPFQNMSTTQAPHFAIAGTTVNIDDMNPAIPPDGQLQPPPNNQEAFREAVQDFHTRRYERVHLEHRLTTDRPYTLLDANDIAELRQSVSGIDPGLDLKDKWAGYPGLTYFSEVYFNAAHTAALVYMNNFCASLCANGQWIYLEKQGSQWVRRSGLNI
jgi:hypothetical protein